MQNATKILEACIFATVICGFFGIILKKNPIANIIYTHVTSTGALAYDVLVAACRGLFTSIVSDDRELRYAARFPQAVICKGDRDRLFDRELNVRRGDRAFPEIVRPLERNEIEETNIP